MEISAAGSAAQVQANVQNQAAVSMLKKTVEITAQQGADLAKMIDQAGGVGQRVDQTA
jgi:hypothetical protein